MNRPTEIALALALAVVLLPVMLLIALLVRLALGRPVIHRSMRAGVRGRRFELIKFRTMPPGAGGGVTGGHKLAKVGRIGRMLRDSRLDELPQIFNIMSGDMSFVGPRPPLPEYADGSRCLWQGKAPGRPGTAGNAATFFTPAKKRFWRPARRRWRPSRSMPAGASPAKTGSTGSMPGGEQWRAICGSWR